MHLARRACAGDACDATRGLSRGRVAAIRARVVGVTSMVVEAVPLGLPKTPSSDAPPEITRTPHDEPLISYSTVSVLALPSEGSPNHDGRCSSRFTIQNLPRAACTRACSESVTSKAPRPFLMPPGWPYCARTILMSGRAAPPLISKSSFNRPAKLPSHVETVPRRPFKMYLTITTFVIRLLNSSKCDSD